jgi:hypothetical protein
MPEENETKIADLTTEEIEAIKHLENQLREGICLLAVEKHHAIYALEVKLAPNQWQRIDEVYPELEGLKAYYSDFDKASSAKAMMKSFLNTQKIKTQLKKRPIRIRKVTGSESQDGSQ